MGNIAIIPARGGSKRIPRKNIKEFCGKPILAYSIEAALKSGVFEEVMVSTDDEEIAAIARQYGASVPFMRSEATANDYAPITFVVKEVLEEYKKLGREFDYSFCIYAASPFNTGEKIREMMELLQANKEADGATAVIQFDMPPQRAFAINEKGGIYYKYQEYQFTRTQDLEPLYYDCGMCFANKVKVVLGEEKSANLHLPFIIPTEMVQDIDSESDWAIAEFKYQWIHRNQ